MSFPFCWRRTENYDAKRKCEGDEYEYELRMSEKVYPGDTEGGCQEMKQKLAEGK